MADPLTDEIERLAGVIYNTLDPLSGDNVSTVLVASDHLFPSREHLEGNSSSRAYQLAAMDICRTIARSVLVALNRHQDMNGRRVTSIVPPDCAVMISRPDDTLEVRVPEKFSEGDRALLPTPNYILLAVALWSRSGHDPAFATQMLDWLHEHVREVMGDRDVERHN